jgi:hypothetical protein
MYLKALTGYESVFKDNHPICQTLRGRFSTLDTGVANHTLTETRENLEGKLEGQPSPEILEETPPSLKRHRLLRRLHLK